MVEWSLPTLLSKLHVDIQRQLETAREAMAHPVAMGDASEGIWLQLLNDYLPKRYKADKAFVVDSNGQFSQQIDVVIYDRQYSPFIFTFKDQLFIPAESVYAVFESKQSATAAMVSYAQTKVSSVRKLTRTSLPIPHAGGTYPAKQPMPILGGLLTFESDWSPPFSNAFARALEADQNEGKLNLGCVAAHGHFYLNVATNKYEFKTEEMAATGFLFKLISQLQACGTVPMIDIDAYARWLVPES